MHHLLLKYSPLMEMLVVFQFFTISNNDAINILMYYCSFHPLKNAFPARAGLA